MWKIIIINFNILIYQIYILYRLEKSLNLEILKLNLLGNLKLVLEGADNFNFRISVKTCLTLRYKIYIWYMRIFYRINLVKNIL